MAEESVYRLIPEQLPPHPKMPIYRSKIDPKLAPTSSSFGNLNTSRPNQLSNVGGHMLQDQAVKKPSATFGKFTQLDTSAILRKNTGRGGGGAALLAADVERYEYPSRTKPSLPSKDELAEWEAKLAATKTTDTKDFIRTNALSQIASKPPRQATAVDWTKKTNFGKVPAYLRKIKKQIEDEYSYIAAMKEQHANAAPEGMRQLAEDERIGLIEDLKVRWESVNAQYQKTSVLSLKSLDSIGKIKRKEMYEAQLAQIERDIEKLSKPVVWVVDE